MTAFISYSRVNSDFAVNIAKDLKLAGFDVWLDQLDIPTGARWDDEIEKALEASNIFLIVLSPESIQSQNVKDEIGYAIDAGKHILPVVIENCKVPFRLRRFQYVDFTAASYEQSLVKIKYLLGNTKELRAVRTETTPVKPARKGISAIMIAVAVVILIALAFLFKTIFTNASPTSTGEVLSTDTSTLPPSLETPKTEITHTPTAPSNTITDINNVQMVFIPSGMFTMGNENDDVNEQPVHTVNVSAFYMDEYEVTNILYQACVDSGDCQPPANPTSKTHTGYYGNPSYNDYPVIYVDWSMAKAYCEWRGARLPTEAEWEKAARGTDGQIYPWIGNDVDCAHANFKGCGGDTVEVGSYKQGVSAYGLYDMAGNVWEWVSDWYQDNYYALIGNNALDPQGPASGTSRVIRGGSWFNSNKSIRTTIRNYSDPLKTYDYVGFRCASDVTP